MKFIVILLYIYIYVSSSQKHQQSDMADHYGSAELLVGKFIESNREKARNMVVMTKWCPKPGEMSEKIVRAAIEERLKRLCTKRVDVLQLHWWNYRDTRYIDAMRELVILQNEGLIGNIGVTNFDTAHLRILLSSGFPVISNQVCFSLLDRRASGKMTDLCLATGCRILAFGCLAGGLLTERYLNQSSPPPLSERTDSMKKYLRFVREAGGWSRLQDLLRVLNEIAKELNCKIAHVAAGWVLSQPAVASVIVGVRLGHSDRSDSNKEIFRVSEELTQRQIERLDSVRLDPIPGDCGDEYRKPPFLTSTGDLSEHLQDANKALSEMFTISSDGKRIGSGTFWEKEFSYSRAVRTPQGGIHVAGTTATHRNVSIGQAAFTSYLFGDEKSKKRVAPRFWVEGETETIYDDRENIANDAYAQTVFALDKVEGALYVLGGHLEDVVRTRLIVRNVDVDWRPVAQAHGERFRGLNPANTLIGGPLVGTNYAVEIEVDAVLEKKKNMEMSNEGESRDKNLLLKLLFFMGVTLVSTYSLTSIMQGVINRKNGKGRR